MKRSFTHIALAAVAAAALTLAGCGGGGGGSASPVVPPTPAPTVQQALAAAAAQPANDTSANSSAPFSVLQAAGVAAVTIASPPKVNFAVFTNGAVKQDLKLSDVSLIIAKLVPGTNGDPDVWQSYTFRTETATAGVGPNGVPALASAKQAAADGKQTDPALAAAQLTYNADGYYTYTFKTDITNPALTNGVTYEPNRTHRVAIQLSYVNAAGETVKVNPYFDFRIGADGKSVAVTDPALTRKMTDVTSCNSCHEKLALHGGGRVDTQFCVTCHNPGTTDANSGNVLTLSTMVHKIHSGKLLKKALDEGKGGEDYTIWGYKDEKIGFAEVGFPQDLRNCTKCHSGSNPATPQGDNWKTRPSKEACLTCHANNAGSDWDTSHKVIAGTLVGAGAQAKALTNKQCADCHVVGSNISPERVHWNQNEENAAKYKMNIESVAFDAVTRKVTVKYFLSDPTAGNAAYNLITPECTYTGTASACTPASGTNNTRFGNLRFYLAYMNMVGQNTAITEFSANNTGGSGANAWATAGTNDGTNHYTVQITVPADTATAVAAGTARVVSIGQIKEPKLQVKWATDPRPEVVPKALVNTVVQHTYMDVALSGPLTPRRVIVSNEKCNACHGSLGTTSGSNTLSEAFHGGARNTVEACVTCHDANKMSATVMTNGLAMNESYQFKRMIHGIHGNSKRTYPFTHGNPVQGPFNKDGALTATGTFYTDQRFTIANVASTVITAGTTVPAGSTFVSIIDLVRQAATTAGYTGAPTGYVENYAAEVAWPGVGINCNACHVNNSYKVDQGPLGAVTGKPGGTADPKLWTVISPKAATCTACHDSSKAIAHVTSFGSASYGNRTQTQSLVTQETCADCHSSGGFKGVDIVHGQK
ncbi:OmcA/MtrC family decaheme c-type cytochrome [Caenimonas koreensis]|uniref:OmcA/MtrC family decaheme c-type cytochrome n=1 Tax=Caenimonas koreensis DSM 17982 TaxID=1121255 RepID=A0A844B3X7_9BURK|nr:OmcA/MtrC family decaheme c-type cytochrome [Caenimonas koreensis]MRD47923.1 OmcA/MtrC family decaheme c-type cytochrome [Caenimonas koreensis DSM 17982]